MFKRPPQAKPSTPLRSSTRRHLLSHLLSLYPILQHAPPDLLARLLPEGTKQCNALTSTGVKVSIYSEPDVGSIGGRALWFEAGGENGAWMSAGKKSGNGGSSGSGNGSSSGKNGKSSASAAAAVAAKSSPLHEVLPTMYTLWLVPNLLPVLPTWQQVIDPALLGGSALMVPGLIPPPNTYATTSTHPDLPPRNALVAIVAYPGTVPQVLARLEMDMREVVSLREQGGKGKAAVVLHAYKDGLWSLGREEGMGELPESVQLLNSTQGDIKGDGQEEREETLTAAMAEANINDQEVPAQQDTSDQAGIAPADPPATSFTTSEIDAILHIALLSAIQDTAISQDSALFPISASAFYSSHVLPHRPSHWPPRPAKGKRAKKSKTKGPPGSFGGSSGSSTLPGLDDTEEEERQLNADQVVVGRSSAKKFGKWLKVMEKERGLIRTKESRGETNIVEVVAAHQDVQDLTPFQTWAEWQAMQDAEGDGGTPAIAATATSENSSGASPSSTPGTSLHVEHFLSASSAGKALFEELGLGLGLSAGNGAQDLHAPLTVRKKFTEYMSAHVSPLPKNQAMVLPDEALCGHLELLNASSARAGQSATGRGIAPRAQGQTQPPPRKREELHRLFIEKCTVSWHRISRLTAGNIERLSSSETDISSLKLAPGEHLGKLVKGAPPTLAPSPSPSPSSGSSSSSSPSRGVITIKIRKRQGNKLVSLLSNLESAYINPDRFAGEVMRQFGTSTSVGPLAGAPVGKKGEGGLKEVLVQGDLRKGLLEKLERENGVPRGLVVIDEKGK